MKLFIKVLLLFLYLVVLNSTAQHNHHDDEKEDSTAHREIPELTVRGIASSGLNFPMQTIGKHLIESHGFLNPADVLHHVPGVSLSRDGVWATSVNIRGFSEAKLLFMVDGDRFQTASDIAGVLSTVDLGSLDKIEVVKGAGSVLFGTGAMGGVVNFIPHRPGYSDNIETNGHLSTGFHTANNLWQNNLRADITNSDWYLSVDGSYRTAGNMLTPEGKIENTQFNDASFGLRGGMKHGDNKELLVTYNHFQGWDVGLPGGSAFPATAQVRYLGFFRNHLSGEYIFSDVSDIIKSVSIKAHTQSIKRDVENLVNPMLAIFPGSMNVTSGLKAVSELYFNDYNTMTVGAETWYRDQKTTRLRIAAPADTIVTGEQPTPNATMLDAGVFVRYTKVIDPKYWTLNVGLRADYIRTSNDASLKEVFKYNYTAGVRTPLIHDSTVLFAARNRNQLAYAAHIDISYMPAKAHRLTLALANAYRVASLEERFKFIDQAGTLRVGDPTLKPEKGFFSNLNYGFTTSRFTLKTDLFANYIFDLITEKQGTYTNANGSSVSAWVNANVDRALYLGAELELKWLITDDLSLQSHVSYVNTTDLLTKEQLPLTPPLHGVVDIHYHLDHLFGLALSADWEYESEDEHVDEALVEAHRHAIFNLSLESEPYRIKGVGVQLFAGVNNIFNTAYQEHLSTLRGINRLEPGRNIYLRTKISW